MFVSQKKKNNKSGPFIATGQLSHNAIGWKTHVEFVISHLSVSICLLLVKKVSLRSVYC